MKKINRIIINCKRCNTPREILPKLLDSGRGKYCSISCARKDHPPTWMHQVYDDKRRHNMSIAQKGKYIEHESNAWKGDKVGYRALHYWVEKHLGKASYCAYDKLHNSTRFHWANISKSYKRELTDWMQLCPKCHKILDRKDKTQVISY